MDAKETDHIQKAIEKIADDETDTLPDLTPMPVLPESEAASEAEPSPETSPTKPIGDILDAANKEISEKKKHTKADISSQEDTAPVHRWFFTFMCMNIPVIGWFYLIFLAFNKKHTDRRNFARAYLFYKLLFLIISVLILGILIYIGLDLLDQLLAYMEML